jgi:integrase
MPLSHTAIQTAKTKAKRYKLYDEKGLFLIVTPGGGKWWRFKYRIDGKEKLLSMGTWPEVSLKDARDKRDRAREQVAAGKDPSDIRKADDTEQAKETTFEVVAREWVANRSAVWEPSNASKILRRLELDVFPYIGKRGIAGIKPPELLTVMRRIEERGAGDTAHRALQNCGQIFRYAIQTGRAERDVAADLRGALVPVKGGHFAAVTDPKQIGGLLRTVRGYVGHPVIRCALQLAPLVFLRPGELRKAQWSEVNLDTNSWHIPAERMKMRQPHIVPLSRQAQDVLKELQKLTGKGQYLFPSPRSTSRPISDNAVLAALRRMGIGKEEMSGHGFRAMARTVLDEVLHVRPDYIEHQLAHAVPDPNGRAYNRTAHLDERRKMMQQWADYLDQLAAAPAPAPQPEAPPATQPTAKAAGRNAKGKK